MLDEDVGSHVQPPALAIANWTARVVVQSRHDKPTIPIWFQVGFALHGHRRGLSGQENSCNRANEMIPKRQIAIWLLLTCAAAESAKGQEIDSTKNQANADAPTATELDAFACEYASPWFGIGQYWMVSPTWAVLKLKPMRAAAVKALDLTEVQQTACDNLPEDYFELYQDNDFVLQFDEDSENDPYAFLDKSQKWKLELLRLRLEGAAVLRRDAFHRGLDLTDAQSASVAKMLEKYRIEKVGTFFQRTYATNLDRRLYDWRITRWAVQFNLEAIRVLKPEEQTLLLKYADESKAVESLEWALVDELRRGRK